MTMRGLMLAALLAGLLPGAAAAQDARVGEARSAAECRCVDAEGNEIEHCRCLRVPRVPLAPDAPVPGMRRARIGVWIDGGQDASLQGVRLQDVQEDGPAWDAGLRAGDVVTRVDGRPVLEAAPHLDDEEMGRGRGSLAVERFRTLVGDLEPGEPVTLEVLRDGESRTFTVTPESGGLAGLRGAAPFVVFRGGEVTLDREALEGFQREARELAEALVRRRDELGLSDEEIAEMGEELRESLNELELDEEELREVEEELREQVRELRSLERELSPRAFGLRGPGEEGVWRFRVPEQGEGRSGFSFFGGDPCVRLLERGDGDARTLRLLADGCLDGVEFVDLNPELASYFDAPATGVLVTEVAEEATLGLRAGDVLLALDGREVESADHARRILRSYDEDEEVRLRVVREGREMEVLGRRRGG